MKRSVAPPSGMPPPTTATMPGGRQVDLAFLAEEACAAYDTEFPDERERYGPAGLRWCQHDNQHLLNWAVLSLAFELDFERELDWLASVLEARDFPLARLARDLELLAGTVTHHHPEEPALSARILAGAAFVRDHDTFPR